MTARTGKKAIRTRPGLTNLEEQVIFYESYHSHPANIAIHLLCIWNIMWTMIYLATYYSPVQMDFPESVASTLHLPDQMKMNLGLAVTILYCVLHSIMEPFLGFICKPIVFFSSQVMTPASGMLQCNMEMKMVTTKITNILHNPTTLRKLLNNVH